MMKFFVILLIISYPTLPIKCAIGQARSEGDQYDSEVHDGYSAKSIDILNYLA
jgi:hypothetical protein